jgi:hypothetical protein
VTITLGVPGRLDDDLAVRVDALLLLLVQKHHDEAKTLRDGLK